MSPTFTLVREYRSGRLPVVHADVYRLERVRTSSTSSSTQSAEDGVLLGRVGRRRRGGSCRTATWWPSSRPTIWLTSGSSSCADRGPDVAPAMGTARTRSCEPWRIERRGGRGLVIVLGIDTSTEADLGGARDRTGDPRHGAVRRRPTRTTTWCRAIERLLDWTGAELAHVGGVAVGIGPGLYTASGSGRRPRRRSRRCWGCRSSGSARSTCSRSASSTRAAGSSP